MPDFTVILEDQEVTMFLGIHAFEKAAPQRVLIRAEIAVTSGTTDKADMFDYDRVVAYIRGFSMTAIETQEELVTRIHAFILSLGARSATVWSRKPDVYPDCLSIGIRYAG